MFIRIKETILNKRWKSKIIVSFITLIVIGLLILAGPAKAFELSLTGFSISEPEKGQKVSTTATIKINSNERMPMPKIGIFIDNELKCAFSLTSHETNCTGINVKLLSESTSYQHGYGYGYGYGYQYGYGYGYNQGFSNGLFTYNITLDTSILSIGEHKVALRVNVKNDPNSLVYSSEQTLTIKTSEEQQHATNQTTIVDENITEIIIDSGSDSVENIIIPSNIPEDKDISLNLNALLSDGNVTLNNNFSLIRQGTNNYSTEIPSGTIISGGSSWDGKINLPTIKTSSDYSIAGGSVDVVIDLGSNIELNFSNPVKVVLGGKAGMKAAWTRNTSLTEITNVCNANHSNIDKDNIRECYQFEGNDLIIWTYHFTKFASFTTVTTTSSVSSTSSGNGGCLTTWQCSGWSSCINEQQTRTCVKANPSCFADIKNKPVEIRACSVSIPITEEEEQTQTSGTGKSGISRITGAVIGTLGTAGSIIVTIIIILGGATLTVSLIRRRKMRKEEE